MRTDSIIKIMAALLKKPCTVKDISQITGLSYSTVGRALTQLSVEPVANSWPVKWKITGDVPKVLDKPEGVFIDTLASRWEAGRDRIGSGISALKMLPDSDPKDLAKSFEEAADTMSNAAYTLREVANKPDWFELIGGNLEDYQVN